ncbi:MAG TPA: hypothetical protein VFD43_02715, partial [Planctomycetota bacterium]|nr:hypothetical protein [Planctomycetota bacterium]
MILSVALLSLSLAAPGPQGADLGALGDQLVHALRARQNVDGTYGAGLADTCRVLDVLGRSSRRYTDQDGPFVRLAAQAVA